MSMNEKELEKKISAIKLPILFSEGRQLQLSKDGALVDGYDPVYSLDIDEGVLKVRGATAVYENRLDTFDDIIVEEFQLDENGNRIYVEPYLKH